MRLFGTGALLRASRSSQIRATSQPSIAATQCTRRCQQRLSRWASTQATASRSYQSNNLASDSSDRNTREDAAQAQAAERRFLKHLASSADANTIVTSESGLTGARILNQPIIFDETSNLSPSILELVGRKLYDDPNHPLCITRRIIESVFAYPTYKNHIATNPVVTVYDNFDRLGFPPDHPGRSKIDTYYVDATRVLRTHTSAHQHAAFEYMSKNPEVGYTICADVYRRDTVDRSHFPVFHQMEGARMWQLPETMSRNETRHEKLLRRIEQIRADTAGIPDHGLIIIDDAGAWHAKTNPVQVMHEREEVEEMGAHLKRSLETLVAEIFKAAKNAGVGAEDDEPLKIRWIEAYFPFTSPSWELEVWWQGQWLELLGCGITQQTILNNAGLKDRVGWAWGIGIERLAMLLFGIPDIRLFWSKDSRFLDQFREGQVTRYTQFSKYPACPKDLSFWLPITSPTASPLSASPSSTSSPETGSAKDSGTGVAVAAGGDSTKSSPTANVPTAFHENDLMEIVRNVAGESAEDVALIDEFVHPKTGRKSLCYRIKYRSLTKTLTTEEAMDMHRQVEEELLQKHEGIELR